MADPERKEAALDLRLRRSSEEPFPYGWPGTVAYAVVNGNGPLEQIRYRDDMRAAVRAAMAGEVRIIAAWPGRYRTDLFVIDDPAKLAAAIGMETRDA